MLSVTLDRIITCIIFNVVQYWDCKVLMPELNLFFHIHITHSSIYFFMYLFTMTNWVHGKNLPIFSSLVGPFFV